MRELRCTCIDKVICWLAEEDIEGEEEKAKGRAADLLLAEKKKKEG